MTTHVSVRVRELDSAEEMNFYVTRKDFYSLHMKRSYSLPRHALPRHSAAFERTYLFAKLAYHRVKRSPPAYLCL